YYVDGIERKIGYRLLIDKAIKGEDIEIWGDKNRKKDMVYVKDFCQMMYKALQSDRKFGHYNVGTGVGTTLEKQIEGIVKVFSSEDNKSKIIERADKPNSPQYVMDIQAARDELGYEPKYNYIDMLKDIKREMIEKRFDC
uniref:GDP-mannose 4,6-dehydratase n=1 Tax=Eshraghiella crossota TaxID=45851 RepID=UPI0040289A6A